MKENRESSANDVAAVRRRAREHTERGAVTEAYPCEPAQVILRLNRALATELVCAMRYRRHYFAAKGLAAKSIATEFLSHSNQEFGHADQIAARIVQLNGVPDYNPDSLTARSHAQYIEGISLIDMIREDLVAERIAIDTYRELVAYVGKHDPTTRRILEGILAVEEEHASDMADLLAVHSPDEPILTDVPSATTSPQVQTTPQAKPIPTR
jgi:bacterioferritin